MYYLHILNSQCLTQIDLKVLKDRRGSLWSSVLASARLHAREVSSPNLPAGASNVFNSIEIFPVNLFLF